MDAKRTKVKDLSAVLNSAPAGEWVALSSDETRIVGHGKSMEEASISARAAGENDFTLIKVPLPNVGLAAPL
jgi:hypothetical protein